jgi:hypothetical protein
VLSGAVLNNDYLQYRNSFYWDKRAMTLARGGKTKAHLYHWVHAKGNGSQVMGILESERPALENPDLASLRVCSCSLRSPRACASDHRASRSRS